ncbi:hypothetical protein DFH09DRAFT_1368374 [Mycena vulgaris]|nr:hypothetical protein DFH09DRAFT_1368374 [Mycena vulgaris]
MPCQCCCRLTLAPNSLEGSEAGALSSGCPHTSRPSMADPQLGTPYWDAICAKAFPGPDSTFILTDILDPEMAGAFNPDVLGYGVRLSSFIMNICAGILIRWGSTKDADAAIQSTLVQIGSIVLCILISLGRGELTLFDGLFTLMVVHSPIAWYILLINIRGLYSWRPAHGLPINAVLCFAIVCGWISLNLVVWFKGRTFPGHNCGSMTMKTYLGSVLLGQLVLVTGETTNPQVVALLCAIWICSCAMYERRLMGLWLATETPNRPAWKRNWLRFRFVFKHYPWLIYMPVIYSYIVWSLLLVVWRIEPGYSFSYGQSLSVMAAVPSLLSVLKLVSKLRFSDLNEIWRKFASDIIFLFLGDGEWAASINKNCFYGQLPPSPGREESECLPLTQSPILSAPQSPNMFLEPHTPLASGAVGPTGPDPHAVADSDGVPRRHLSLYISDVYVPADLFDATPTTLVSLHTDAEATRESLSAPSPNRTYVSPTGHIHTNSTSIPAFTTEPDVLCGALTGDHSTVEPMPRSESPIDMLSPALTPTRLTDDEAAQAQAPIPHGEPKGAVQVI